MCSGSSGVRNQELPCCAFNPPVFHFIEVLNKVATLKARRVSRLWRETCTNLKLVGGCGSKNNQVFLSVETERSIKRSVKMQLLAKAQCGMCRTDGSQKQRSRVFNKMLVRIHNQSLGLNC